ncbi:MAG: Spore coat protein CotH [Bacteroidetes bacterium]|nr:Spore coat protein CotH [Bacteroidota bacterium]
MKPILKTKRSPALPIKLAIAFCFVLGLISLVLGVHFSSQKNKLFKDLKISNEINPPDCSSIGGFSSEEISVSLSSTQPGLDIYYTLDGSEPSLGSEIYTRPIYIEDRTKALNLLSAIPNSPRWKPPVGNVFKGTVLRTICVSADNKKSKELVNTYFVDEKGSSKYTLPVLEITVNKDDLFGYKDGIYVMGKNYEDKRDYIRKELPLDMSWWEYPANYLKRGLNSERDAHIEFFETNGSLAFESDAGIRIHGNATRGFSQKSLRICFDEKYGKAQLNYQLFPDYKLNKFNSFILRNGGNDWNKTMFRDALIHTFMKDSHLDVQAYRPLIVFINGEYWGVHTLRERLDEYYLVNKYDISKDSLVILEFGGSLVYGKKHDDDIFRELLDFVKKNDMNLEANYSYLKKKIDILSFMDGIIANVYFCNADWPNNNVRFWRYKAAENQMSDSLFVKDGRWRWMLYDTDWGFGYTGKEAISKDLLGKAKAVGSVGVLFRALLKNKVFLNEFKARFQYHLDNTFEKEKVIKRINEFQDVLAPEMPEHINRWRVIGSYSKWKDYVEELRDFASQRPSVQIRQLNDFINNETNSVK